MIIMSPKHIVASALTLMVMVADTMTVSTRPVSAGGNTLEPVAAYASSLDAGAKSTHTLAFEKGREYHVEATCADGCGIDMQLFSSSGRELDRFVGGAGTPEVAVIPSNTGSYRAEVTMAACSHSPCAYTLTVFAR